MANCGRLDPNVQRAGDHVLPSNLLTRITREQQDKNRLLVTVPCLQQPMPVVSQRNAEITAPESGQRCDGWIARLCELAVLATLLFAHLEPIVNGDEMMVKGLVPLFRKRLSLRKDRTDFLR